MHLGSETRKVAENLSLYIKTVNPDNEQPLKRA